MAIETNLDELYEWISASSQLFIKKLSQNDCRWADGREHGHQNGPYIPSEIWGVNFFPALRNMNASKPHIVSTLFPTLWPATGERKESRLAHYSNKGAEVQFTRVPKDHFSALTPASLFVGGILRVPSGDARHWFTVVDAGSEAAETIEATLDLSSEFHYGLFNAQDIVSPKTDKADTLIALINSHIAAGTLDRFIAVASKLPAPQTLALNAQNQYLEDHSLSKLDPYAISNPGDVIMKISRDIEYSLYKEAELQHRAAEVIRIVTAGGPDLVSSVVRGFSALDASFLSASQHRKSRAGRSFEQHIARLLTEGNISFEEQVVTGGRRPDFVLPSVTRLKQGRRVTPPALVLSAKTTLRERWKQIVMEKFDCDLYLATVDDRVSREAIAEMGQHGIQLVVPEALKKSPETCYEAMPNVITFREFFDLPAVLGFRRATTA